MNEIFIQYISEYTNRRRRAYALVNATQTISVYSEVLGTENIKSVMRALTGFAETYDRALPWNRGKVVAEQVRSFTFLK